MKVGREADGRVGEVINYQVAFRIITIPTLT
jgi:hypothetical protein